MEGVGRIGEGLEEDVSIDVQHIFKETSAPVTPILLRGKTTLVVDSRRFCKCRQIVGFPRSYRQLLQLRVYLPFVHVVAFLFE